MNPEEPLNQTNEGQICGKSGELNSNCSLNELKPTCKDSYGTPRRTGVAKESTELQI